MRRWILVSVACFALGVHVAYTFSDKLMANDEQSAPIVDPPRSVVLQRPEPSRYDANDARVTLPTPTPAVVPEPSNVVPPLPYAGGSVIDTPWSSPPGSPKQVGTYTVVSDGKRSILLNTSKGDSWRLIVDNPGSHWEPIAMGVAKGGKTEISWSAAPAGATRTDVEEANDLGRERQAKNLENDRSRLEAELQLVSDELSKSRRRERTLESEVEELSDSVKELKKSVAQIHQKNKGLEKSAEETISELTNQLYEAKRTLEARPQPAPPSPVENK
jgi:hypothetical protein